MIWNRTENAVIPVDIDGGEASSPEPVTLHESEGLALFVEGGAITVEAEGYEPWTFDVDVEGPPRELSRMFAATIDLTRHPAIAERIEGRLAAGTIRLSLKGLRGLLRLWSLESESFRVVTGLLCADAVNGVELWLCWSEDGSLILESRRGDAVVGSIPVNLKVQADKRTQYLQLTRTKISACPYLGRVTAGRLRRTSSNSVGLHDIVLVVGDGADFTLVGGDVGGHHWNGNGGDNRIGNLFMASTGNHNLTHRFEDQNPDAAEIPQEIVDAILAEHARFTGRPLPKIDFSIAARGNVIAADTDNGDAYNPESTRITDLSLSFDRGRMVVSSTFLTISPELDDEGNEKKDADGRTKFVKRWRPTTVASDGRIIEPDEELPADFTPYKQFHLEGIDGEPRWSREDMERFAAGREPETNLAERIVESIDRHVAFSKHAHLYVVAAFIAMTYVFPLVRRVPFLALHSLVPGAGKTTLIELIHYLAFNALRMGASSLAVIVRLADRARCTLLMDEQENLASPRHSNDLIEVMNSRSDAGATYQNLSPGMEPQSFDLFGPTVVANLSGLAPTLRSRSIVIEMQPMALDDPRQFTKLDPDPRHWRKLRGQLYLWAGRNWKAVKETYDTDPSVLVGRNRHADLWRLLLSVAKHFGGEKMFEALRQEAVEAAKAASPDEIAEAMVIGLDAVLQEIGEKASERSLEHVKQRACRALEEDQRKFLSSKRVKAFCQSMGLEVRRSSRCDGANAVFFTNPASTRKLLRKRYPLLVGSEK